MKMLDVFDRIRRWWEKTAAFLGKYFLVILAIGLSVLIRWVIREQLMKPDKRSFQVRIEIQHKPEEILLGTPTPEYVTISLAGSQSVLEQYTDNDFVIKLDTARAKRTSEENGEILCVWELTHNMVTVPPRLKVEQIISGKQVQLALDLSETKQLPVIPVLNEAELPQGYKVGNVTVKPGEVSVSAPASKLKLFPEIRTKPISLKNITHSFDCDQGFEAPDSFDFDRKNVLVKVEILRATNKTMVLKTVPVRILVPPSSRQQTMSYEIVSAPTVDVEVSGEGAVIDNLHKDDVFVFANISEFTKPGLYWIDLRCAVDSRNEAADAKITDHKITVRKIDPPKVNVKLEQINRR
ncbi:MAG: hypothetical protein IJS14_06380 [Lentisphaeria bacterium]|nr:hypothetical protein [Lentisphaeria bacterium]